MIKLIWHFFNLQTYWSWWLSSMDIFPLKSTNLVMWKITSSWITHSRQYQGEVKKRWIFMIKLIQCCFNLKYNHWFMLSSSGLCDPCCWTLTNLNPKAPLVQQIAKFEIVFMKKIMNHNVETWHEINGEGGNTIKTQTYVIELVWHFCSL